MRLTLIGAALALAACGGTEPCPEQVVVRDTVVVVAGALNTLNLSTTDTVAYCDCVAESVLTDETNDPAVHAEWALCTQYWFNHRTETP